MKKRLVSILLTLCMLASLFAVTAFADEAHVASVNGVGYSKLTAAINAASDGDTVTLLASYSDYKVIQISKTITLDLNGFDIYRTFGGGAVDITDGTVTITGNGTISGPTDGILVAYDAALVVKEGVTVEGRDGHGIDSDGAVTIDGATVTATKYGIALYSDAESGWAASLEMLGGSVSGSCGVAAYANTIVTVKGGTITGTSIGLSGEGGSHGTTFKIEGGTIQSESGVGIYHPQNGTLNISGGTISGATGINMKSGNLTVTGGTIQGTGEKADYSFVGGGFNPTGDAIVIESCAYPGGAPTASITGGTFTSENADSVASHASNGVTAPVTGFISGGEFTSDPSALCADGYTGYQNADGAYRLTEADESAIDTKATVTIAVFPENADVEIKQGDSVIGTGAGTYELPGGTYTYTVSKYGYLTESGTFTVAGNPLTIQVRLTSLPGLLAIAGGAAYCPSEGYADVDVDAWYHDAVDYVLENGLMTGVAENSFAPNGTMTRAMVWTVLGRISGEEFNGTGANWYAQAQNWAIINGVSDGTNPNGAVTREELVTMLWRFVGEPDADVAAIQWYYDGETVSDWAKEAMTWAVECAIIEGANWNLNPQATALRSQVAAILMRYCG